MTHLCVQHDSSTCATWLIHVCDVIHSYAGWRDNVIHMQGDVTTTMVELEELYVWHDLFPCGNVTHSYLRRGSFMCATCLIQSLRHTLQHTLQHALPHTATTWLFYVRGMPHSMTRSHHRHASFKDSFTWPTCLIQWLIPWSTCLIHVCHGIRPYAEDMTMAIRGARGLIRVIRLFHVWHDSFTCDMPRWRWIRRVRVRQHDLFICATWLIHVCNVTRQTSMCRGCDNGHSGARGLLQQHAPGRHSEKSALWYYEIVNSVASWLVRISSQRTATTACFR